MELKDGQNCDLDKFIKVSFRLELDDLYDPFHSKPFYDSVSLYIMLPV